MLRMKAGTGGTAPNFGSFEADGHYHCMFSKAFIYLTDNGLGEGTWGGAGQPSDQYAYDKRCASSWMKLWRSSYNPKPGMFSS